MKSARLIEVGEVWGIRLDKEPNAPWYDVCVILGVDETSGNCTALSTMSGMFVPDFVYDGLPLESMMDSLRWERIA